MTCEEICRHYRMAKSKREDIKVLADLNATDEEKIRSVLIDGGILLPEKPKKLRKPREKTTGSKIVYKRIEEMLDAGKSNREISDETGCTMMTVRNHRKKRREADIACVATEA